MIYMLHYCNHNILVKFVKKMHTQLETIGRSPALHDSRMNNSQIMEEVSE